MVMVILLTHNLKKEREKGREREREKEKYDNNNKTWVISVKLLKDFGKAV